MNIYQLFEITIVQGQRLPATLHQAKVCNSLADRLYLHSLLDVDLQCTNEVFQRRANKQYVN